MTRKRIIKLLMSGNISKRSAEMCLLYLDLGAFNNYFDVLSFYLPEIKHDNFKEYYLAKQNEEEARNIFNRWFESL